MRKSCLQWNCWHGSHTATQGRLALQEPGASSILRVQRLSKNSEEGYAAIIIAIASVAFAFVQCDDVSIPHVLWYFAFTPTEAEDFMQLRNECLFAALQYFSRNAVFPWCFARGKRVQGFAEFVYGWFSVKAPPALVGTL